MRHTHRVHIIYSGNVQGVGFRFTTENIALRYGVNGFVRNMSDGDVEVVVEGDKKTLDELLHALGGKMDGYISNARVEWEPATGEFSSFGIRF